MTRTEYDDREAFLAALRALRAGGTPADSIRLQMPFEVPEVEELMGHPPDRLKFFPLLGALGGFGTGLALTIYSVVSFPIMVGGKPIVSLPPFLLIGYLLTILFGALATFAGFLLLARMPSPSGFAEGAGPPARFVIVVDAEGTP
jgi:hypothetical protein